MTQSESKSEDNLEISKNLLEYADVFFNKKISILPALKRGDYAINLDESKKSPYRSLYNLS